jgi:uncharacterized membrane protein YhaH (DUF805 family)
MSHSLWPLFASFQGRLSRSGFWCCAVALGALFVVLFVFIEHAFGHAATLVLYPPLLWFGSALAVKRLHDRGHSGWRLLLLLIPILGPLWIGISLALRSGTRGDNQYGPDPLVANADYLVVR